MKPCNCIRSFAVLRAGPRHNRIAGALAVAFFGAMVSGCGVQTSMQSSSQQGEVLRGRVFGGQQPVSGASITLYAAGSGGAGVGAYNLLTPNSVTTDGSGSFGITGDYTCPTATTQVYIVARGGNPGLAAGTNNAAMVLMAALGNCDALMSSTTINLNEATTAASAWALSQFLGSGAIIGSTATNATGLANAFAVANNLVNTSTGFAPGSTLPAGAVTETAKLYTLADAIASCVNSDGTAACTPLFAAATTSSGVPANTLDAALNIVKNPAANVAAVFSAAASRGPFQPALSAHPKDWTMSVTYAGGGLDLPGSVAIDSAGNAVVANYFGGAISKFSPAGVPASATGFPGTGLAQSYGIAVDGSDNVWVTNEQSVTGANNHHDGSISKFSPAGVEQSGYGYTVGGIYYPSAVASDTNGTIWIADYGSSSATLLNNDGTAISGSGGYAASALPFTSAVAVDANHNAWFAVQKGVASVTPAGVVSSFPCCADPAGIAVDPAGDVWVADYNASTVVELMPSGVVANRTVLSGGNGGPQGIAIDGAGNVWAANYYGNSLAELSGASASVLSPALGYGLDAPLSEPYGLAVDASGNLWLSNAGSNTITQIVGLANPIRTPLLGPPAQP